MDVFLIRNGVIWNVVKVEDMQTASVVFYDFEIVERTEANQHLQIGDTP